MCIVKIVIELIPKYWAFILVVAFAYCFPFIYFLYRICSYWFGIKEEYVEADEREKNKLICI